MTWMEIGRKQDDVRLDTAARLLGLAACLRNGIPRDEICDALLEYADEHKQRMAEIDKLKLTVEPSWRIEATNG